MYADTVRRVRPWARAFREALLGDTPVLAGGVALFAVLAAIPGVAFLVAVYGLIADPADIAPQLEGLSRVLPRGVVTFLVESLEREAGRSRSQLGLALVTTLALALYSSRSVADALMVGLNHAYGVRENRHPWRTFAISVLLAAGTLLGTLLIAMVVVALPVILALLHIRGDTETLATLIRWPLLVVTVLLGLRFLYKHAPSPRNHEHVRYWPGALVAAGLWLSLSIGLSIWVDAIADYESIYGAFASVLVLILWLYLSALTILLGGLVNAELERAMNAVSVGPAPASADPAPESPAEHAD